MNVLVLSLDKNFLNQQSAVCQRSIIYGGVVDFYAVLVPYTQKVDFSLSNSVHILSSGGRDKVRQFFNLLRIGEQIVSQKQVDVISVQDPFFLGLLGVYLSKKFKVGLEVQVHGWEKNNIVRKILSRFVLGHATSVRTVSQRLKKELVVHYKIDEKKITVVPILLESRIENVPELKKRSKFIFLTVGRLVKIKNIPLQILAAAELKYKGLNFEWWIIGEGQEESNLRKLTEQLMVGEDVKFLGQKTPSELYSYYKAADCFVLTSDYEGWGMVVVEAARIGLPVIMTDVGCAGELIVNNESGLVVKNSLVDLVAALEKIYHNDRLRVKFIKNAKDVVEKLPKEKDILNLYITSWEKAKI